MSASRIAALTNKSGPLHFRVFHVTQPKVYTMITIDLVFTMNLCDQYDLRIIPVLR